MAEANKTLMQVQQANRMPEGSQMTTVVYASKGAGRDSQESERCRSGYCTAGGNIELDFALKAIVEVVNIFGRGMVLSVSALSE